MNQSPFPSKTDPKKQEPLPEEIYVSGVLEEVDDLPPWFFDDVLYLTESLVAPIEEALADRQGSWAGITPEVFKNIIGCIRLPLRGVRDPYPSG